MSLLITVSDLKQLLTKITLTDLLQQTIDAMREDYARWHDFHLVPRIATHYPHGVIELMPISDQQDYAFKYVNGHPQNPQQDRLTVMAIGMLAEVATGYPVLISEMTVLTAIRTAAASALASQYLARHDTRHFGMIGTGSQSEFQVLAHQVALGIDTVFYYDIDPQAMEKFAFNLRDTGLTLQRCESVDAVVQQVELVTTATADKSTARVLHDAMVTQGIHINGIGGDCPGKTELDPRLLQRCKIVVEYLQQSLIEGEIQTLTPESVHAELWEVVTGRKTGREHKEETTLFDSVGIALEDYTMLRVIYRLAQEYQIGQSVDMIPQLRDPKNLFSALT